MLKILYQTLDNKPQQLYMILICFLILSEDISFNQNIQKIQIEGNHLTWFQERIISKITLGSFFIIILVRTIQINFLKIRDKNIHNNGLAILSNMAPYIIDMHPYTAHKLLKLFEFLSKKFLQIQNLLLFNNTLNIERYVNNDLDSIIVMEVIIFF